MARRHLALKMPDVKDVTTFFGAKVGYQGAVTPGGLDLLTPQLQLHPGACRDMSNFEVSPNGGYGRIACYERFNGLPSPSEATFVIVQVSSYVTVPTVGQSIAQASSGALGVVALVSNVAGAYYMVVTKTSGTFDTTGVVTSPNNSYTITAANSPLVITSANSPFVVPLTATTIGTAITPTVQLTAMLNAQYQADAADIYREDIDPVPGSGDVLGVVHMIFDGDDEVYAFRANAGGTAVDIWKASASGWVQVPLFNLVSFTLGGTAVIEDGDTLIQGPATATIMRVMAQSGGFEDDTLAGTMVVRTPNFGFGAGAATTSGGATLTLAGAQTPITILPGGSYEFSKYNFMGQLGTRDIYGCDGVNLAFQFDGTTYAPIVTGNEPSVPSHILGHKSHLFVSYGSSLIYSGDGDPFRYGATDGGGEIATGDDITNIITLPGDPTTAAMGVWMLSTTGILYGTGQDSWNFILFNQGTGANPKSVQNLFDTLAFPDVGIVNMKTTLNYGNFNAATLTKNIQPLINQQRSKILASTVNRSKGQYRVFFDDGAGLYLTFANAAYLGAAPMQFPNPVGCIDNDTDTDGNEVTYFGSNDGMGYVYQLDVGPSFDGENVFAYFVGAWDYIKNTTRWLKRYRNASIEIQGTAYAAVDFGYALGGNTPLISQPMSQNYQSSFSPARWDAATWDNFFWDGQTVIPTYADMTGTAVNVQPTIGSSTNYIQPYIVSSISYDYVVRRHMRGL